MVYDHNDPIVRGCRPTMDYLTRQRHIEERRRSRRSRRIVAFWLVMALGITAVALSTLALCGSEALYVPAFIAVGAFTLVFTGFSLAR